VDGRLHKAPCGGEGTGLNPTDRAKTGWKWSIATDLFGIPIGRVIDGANRNDSVLLEPTLQAVAARGLLPDIETLHLDKGYDSALTTRRCHGLGLTDVVCAKKKRKGAPKTKKTKKPRNCEATTKKTHTLGLRWPVERTNSWFSNFGQLRRNTDRFITQRLGQIALAITLILTVKLVKWVKRWTD
jgi:IS5 family transposase